MTGITKDELMQMARDAQVIGGEFELEAFANAILERAAEKMEVQHTWVTNIAASNLVRDLKINTGD